MTTMAGASQSEAPPEFDKFTEVEVLFYYDGPLLTHYRDLFGNDWVKSLFGGEDETNPRGGPWLWVWVRVPNFKDYYEDRIDYLTVFKTSPEMWLFKESDNSYTRKLFDELDPEAIPLEGSFLHIHEEKS